MNRLIVALVAFCIATLAMHPVFAQNVDISSMKADPVNKVFDDGETTVASYVYDRMAKESNCCESDDVFLELKIDDQGYVTSAKAISGGSSCYKQSAEDIAKYIRWDASKLNSSSVYLSLKFNLDCKGENDNAYAEISAPAGWAGPEAGAVASAEAPTEEAPAEEASPAEEPVAEAPAEETPAEEASPAEEPVAEAPAEEAPAEEKPVAEAAPAPATQTPVPATKPAPAPVQTQAEAQAAETPKQEAPAVAAAQKDSVNPAKEIPAELPEPKYTKAGDKNPDASHKESHMNTSGPSIYAPSYKGGDRELALYLKTSFRDAGVCGLAQALVEMNVDSAGLIQEYRLFSFNNETVHEALPDLIKGMTYEPTGRSYPTYFIQEFKAYIRCEGMEKVDLSKVGYLFVTPENAMRNTESENEPLEVPTDN